ncbi:toprim domain-containing protein (plasmid) [Glycocaulis abyssi]|uniref:Toprim domain-containing protein n=1 Tax=Glycocaulis abyssi TaxID=1433403 RepID=A0ABV9NE50_9PROT
MSRSDAADLARRLGRQAEAVCRHYLPNGRRDGQYWRVGDARGEAGRSMFVRLADAPGGPAGKWTDAATGEHGDLLDIIRETRGLSRFSDILAEARRFLALPEPEPVDGSPPRARPKPAVVSPTAARRLFAAARPIRGTLAETYLRARRLTRLDDLAALRFHPRCTVLPGDGAPRQTWPALIASVTDLSGAQTGAHRTWLARDGAAKAPLDPPRKAMGQLLGHGVRFGRPGEVLAAGEGLENALSVREALPGLPSVAALSAAHLGALALPPGLRRLYVILDADAAGEGAFARLAERAREAGVEARPLRPARGDFNDDLLASGARRLNAALARQLAREDRVRFGGA